MASNAENVSIWWRHHDIWIDTIIIWIPLLNTMLISYVYSCFIHHPSIANHSPLIKLYTNHSILKDLSMMYSALWDRRHEGATTISQCTRRVAPSALTYPSGPWVPPISQCTIMLKSDYDINYLVLIHYEAEICKQSSEAGGGESCIVENLCMVL